MCYCFNILGQISASAKTGNKLRLAMQALDIYFPALPYLHIALAYLRFALAYPGNNGNKAVAGAWVELGKTEI